MSQTYTVDDLKRLFAVARHVNEETVLERLFPRILDAAIEAVGAERGFLAVLEDGSPTLRVSRGFGGRELSEEDGEISRGVLQQVLDTGRPVHSTEAMNDTRFSGYGSVLALGIRSVYCLPLAPGGRLLGALYLDSRRHGADQLLSAAPVLELLAEHASVALEKARSHEELRRRGRELEISLERIEELNRRLEGRVRDQARQIERFEGVVAEEQESLAALFPLFVGSDPSLLEVRRTMERATRVDYPVLVLGESGTGKEVVARSVHAASGRRRREMISVNCSALSPSLMDSQLFGHARGAFTGADRTRRGFLEAAHNGTLFLDEFGDLPPEAQARLLRVVECGEIYRVGDETPTPVNVRLIMATNRNLPALIRDGRFREDLYFRLNTITIRLPPMRERRRDILTLANRFLAQASREVGAPGELTFSESALIRLEQHDWPGNVREILSVVRRAALGAAKPVVDATDLVFESGGPTVVENPPEVSRRHDLPADLPRRVAGVLERLRPDEILTFRRYRALAGVARATAAADLADLVRRGVYRKTGRTASVLYHPVSADLPGEVHA